MHWSRAARIRKAAGRIALRLHVWPKATGPRELHLVRRGHGLLDTDDNLNFAYKALRDALVAMMLLTGDAPRDRNVFLYSQERIPRAAAPHTLVQLRDL